jgi:predicted aspartyl protease
MVTGVIEQSRYPKLVLPLVAQGKQTDLKFLIDTGFDSEVALSYDGADRFELEILQYAKVTYANGKSEQEIIARGKIVWFGTEREVRVILSDDEEPAIGTRLLKGCVMTMDFIHDSLTIEQPRRTKQ